MQRKSPERHKRQNFLFFFVRQPSRHFSIFYSVLLLSTFAFISFCVLVIRSHTQPPPDRLHSAPSQNKSLHPSHYRNGRVHQDGEGRGGDVWYRLQGHAQEIK